MGVEYNALKTFFYLKDEKKANLTNLATIGRQGLYIKKKTLNRILKKCNVHVEKKKLDELFAGGFSEKIFTFLGAKNIDSFDYSDYEDPTVLHDMNKEIGEQYHKKYDIVFDGGSLEHVFNFPIAIKNCLNMVKTGGYFVTVTVCNNFSGHGFYQFSPELFYSIFNVENSFSVDSIFISVKNKWYSVTDPKEIRKRVIFKNNNETYLIVIAKRNSGKELNETKIPMQSDYVELWDKKADNNDSSSFFAKAMLLVKKKCIRYDKDSFKKHI